MQKSKPKEYWKLLNSLNNRSNKNMPSLDEFTEHFKKLNASQTDDTNFNLGSFDPVNGTDELNSYITRDEIMRNINKLKNGKAAGYDSIANEYIKNTKHILIPVYEALFNIILDTGNFPEQWTVGIIKPVYKNKGNSNDVNNFRPITILSCLGKLFTSILNNRLSNYLEESMLLLENQAGFRKDYSTLDHIFSLNAVIEILKYHKKKLFCCFVDFSSAFDSVWRVGLWQKLLNMQIKGKVLTVIYNMYDDIKSCVSVNGENSSFFASACGVRQGENLSPVLFSIYLNDLENFLDRPDLGIDFECNNDEFYTYFKLIVLLYADDTVLLADSEIALQRLLDSFHNYCSTWKLTVNINKTKVVVFGAKKTDIMEFRLSGKIVEIVDRYKYLGVIFSGSRSFLNCRKHIVEQAKKAMHLLFCRINNLYLPVDLQLQLFDHTVLPILTYACEIWGFENLDIIETVHTEFLRKITKSRKSTPLYMLYAELGRVPLEITIKTRIVSFWNKLICGKFTKISFLLYQFLRNYDQHDSKWITCVKNILSSVGRNDIWEYQNELNDGNCKDIVKQILIDQFQQKWHENLSESSKGIAYYSFKDRIALESYFTTLPKHLVLNMVRFRTSNHRLPIETGRWYDIDLDERICPLCTTGSLGDEYHYLLECPAFKTQRLKYIDKRFYRRPNMLLFRSLLTQEDTESVAKLSIFMGIIVKHFAS